ncbi:transglutaminase domain-containing protein [Bacteroides salyersiae]|nr:transglutaminase domain-containing protein [Bacteroides sp. CAG:189]UYU47151.1 transglutaminase domain-containing protein [Bacteroides salyersiae]
MLTAVVPGALIEFRDLANSITRYDNSEYNKILSVHDWIAKNIFYDYDSLNDGSYKNTPLEKTAITALRNRRCVCQGYTDLSVALLRSIGIPAMGICCWAVGECNDDEALNQNRSNHIFTAAFCGGNWMLCDITWDSMNRYENDSYDEDKKLSHTYFDATVQFLSYTHRFVGY